MTTRAKNRLLRALPARDWVQIHKYLEPVELIQGRVLVAAGERFSHVYFPEEGVISTVATFETGATAEMAATGPEGVVGVGAVLGGARALNRKVVQVPGTGYRVELRFLKNLQRDYPGFRHELLAYIQAFLGQAMQSVACNGIHSLEERCARWLLECHDRMEHDRFSLTQEFLAEMLGVSRPAVNRIARTLQAAGLISYTRGVMEIKDRHGLKKVACECYATIRGHFDRILPGSFVR